MSGLGHISPEKSQQCDLCGEIAELRPYGPKGECICYKCGMKNPKAAFKRFAKHVMGRKVTDKQAEQAMALRDIFGHNDNW